MPRRAAGTATPPRAAVTATRAAVTPARAAVMAMRAAVTVTRGAAGPRPRSTATAVLPLRTMSRPAGTGRAATATAPRRLRIRPLIRPPVTATRTALTVLLTGMSLTGMSRTVRAGAGLLPGQPELGWLRPAWARVHRPGGLPGAGRVPGARARHLFRAGRPGHARRMVAAAGGRHRPEPGPRAGRGRGHGHPGGRGGDRGGHVRRRVRPAAGLAGQCGGQHLHRPDSGGAEAFGDGALRRARPDGAATRHVRRDRADRHGARLHGAA